MIVIVLCNIRYVTEKVILWKVYECGSYFISSWNMVIWVSIILKRTCVDIDWCFDNLCCSRYSEWSKWVAHVGWYWPDWLISRPLSKWGWFQYHETSIYIVIATFSSPYIGCQFIAWLPPVESGKCVLDELHPQ